MTVNTLGGEVSGGRERPVAWLWPLVPTAIAAFALSALVAYHVRADGLGGDRSALQSFIVGLYEFVGFAPSFLFFLLVLSWSSIWLVTGRLERPGIIALRLGGLTLLLAIWVNLRVDPSVAMPHSGALGAWIGTRMVSVLGYFVSVMLVAPLTLAALLLATDYFFIRYFEGTVAPESPSEQDVAGDSTEGGVESDVTEHFKGLSTVLSPAPSCGS